MKSNQSALIIQAIKQRRMQLGYSQEYMAYKIQMSQNAYSKIELGYSKLTVDRMIDICEVLNIKTAEMVDDPLVLKEAV